MSLKNILNEAPSPTQLECHGQDLKEGLVGERSQWHEVPNNLVSEEMSMWDSQWG